MPDLLAISRNTLQMQQRHERLEPRIGWCRVCWLTCVSPGLDVASSVRLRQQRLLGSAVDQQSASHRGHRPPSTKLDAMNWPSRARPAACEPSLAVEVPPVLLLFAAATVTVGHWPVTFWPLMTR